MSGQIEIIYCFRDRESGRVRASLQSLLQQEDQNFHVTFIDYGSNKTNSEAVEMVCKDFEFCSYYYINTQGKMWNRGDALNQGILLSRSEHLFFSDIDMLFLPGFIALLHRLTQNVKAHFFPVGYLSKRNTQKVNLKQLEKLPFKKSSDYASGMLLAPRNFLQSINGYHTFFSLWGLEDNDLKHRLSLNNFPISQVQEVYLLHQYHTPVPEDQSLPQGWIQFMKDHYKSQANQKINSSGITQSLSISGRPAQQILNDPNTNYRDLTLRSLYLRHSLLETIYKSKVASFRIHPIAPDKQGFVQKYGPSISRLLRKLGLHAQLQSDYQSQYISKKEILSEIFFVVKSTGNAIQDYYINEKKDHVELIIVMR